MSTTAVPNGLLMHVIGDLTRFAQKMEVEGNRVGARILHGIAEDLVGLMERPEAREEHAIAVTLTNASLDGIAQAVVREAVRAQHMTGAMR